MQTQGTLRQQRGPQIRPILQRSWVPPDSAWIPSPYSRSPPVFSGYSEAATRGLDEGIADEDVIAEHYDYDSDSDLEDEEDLKTTEQPLPVLRGHPFDPFCFAPDENDSSESNGDSVAGDRPQDTIRYFQPPPPLNFPCSHLRLNSSEGHVPAYYEEGMKEGKVIKVQDVAFITYVDSCPMPLAD